MVESSAAQQRSLRAVLFDFDGTLADTYPGIAASVNHVRAGYQLPPLPLDDVRRKVGRGPAYLIEQTVPAGDVTTNVARYKAHQPTVMRSGTRLCAGVAEALPVLKGLRLRLAVCSNKPRSFLVDLLDHFGLAPLFDVIVGPEDVPRPKPAPDVLLKALQLLHVAAAEALYVGDMVVDIEAARAAGVAVWVVPTGSDERSSLAAARPDRLLDGFGDLSGLLNGVPRAFP